MENSDIKHIQELFGRLFVIAVQNKINFFSFTTMLAKSEFVSKIEQNHYDDYFNKPLEDIFFHITHNRIKVEESYGIYNDAYWCGISYFNLYLKTHKPLSYIFLKLPLATLIDVYAIFHEMDFSSLLDYFQKKEKEKTILRLLCEQNKCSLTKLSVITGIKATTLAKYNASDEALYRGSFQNIIKIARYFDVTVNMFVIIL